MATARVVEAAVSYVLTERLGAEQLSLVALKVLRGTIEAAPPAAGARWRGTACDDHRTRSARPGISRAPCRQRRAGRLAGALRRVAPRSGRRCGTGSRRRRPRHRSSSMNARTAPRRAGHGDYYPFGERHSRARRSHEHVDEPVDRHALLLERVAVAQRHRPVLERLVVDRHAQRRADLVLAAVALADRAALVVLGLHPRAQRRDDLAGDFGLAVLLDERQHRDLHRRQPRVQLEHGARLAADVSSS